MAATTAEMQHLKRSVALLTACIAFNLESTDPTFRKRFLDSLAQAYEALAGESSFHQLELFAWTRDYMKGFELRDKAKRKR